MNKSIFTRLTPVLYASFKSFGLISALPKAMFTDGIQIFGTTPPPPDLTRQITLDRFLHLNLQKLYFLQKYRSAFILAVLKPQYFFFHNPVSRCGTFKLLTAHFYQYSGNFLWIFRRHSGFEECVKNIACLQFGNSLYFLQVFQ